MTEVSIVIVTYNSGECVGNCLEHLFRQKGATFEIIVVDNASSDDTVLKVRNTGSLLIEGKENIGFGKACNIGFSRSKGKYIFLLNPDTQLASDQTLAKICRLMGAKPRWGLAGTKVVSTDGSIESPPAVQYPGEKHVKRDFSALPGTIAWVMGASMVIRRDVYRQLGGFDPDYFLYSEETDLCLRARELGYEIGWMEDVVVRHVGGDSEKSADPYDVACRKLRGLLTFRRKHYSREECAFLANRDRRRACFRMVTNGALAGLKGRKSKEWEKYRSYRGIWEMSKISFNVLQDRPQTVEFCDHRQHS